MKRNVSKGRIYSLKSAVDSPVYTKILPLSWTDASDRASGCLTVVAILRNLAHFERDQGTKTGVAPTSALR